MTLEPIDKINRVGLKLLALRHAGVHFGRIMSPAEVIESANESETAELAGFDSAWSLCGDTSSEMFKLVQTGEAVAMRFTVFGHGNQLYLVITHQIRSLQHRFILPMYEAAVHEFLAHAVKKTIWFSFGDNGKNEAVVLRSFYHQRDLMPALSMAPKWEPQDKVGALSKLLDATHDLSKVNKVPSSFKEHTVSHVSTTIVAPRTVGEVDGSFDTEAEDLLCR